MAHQQRPRKTWSEIGHAILNAIETVLDIVVDHAPKIGKKVGKFVVAVFDIVVGAFTLTYIFNQLTPPEFMVTAKIFAWAISAATYFFVNDLFEGAQEDPYKIFFAWGLNLVDALFIDAGAVFILFGQAGFVSGNWEKFIDALYGMPIFGWALYVVAAGLSLWAEWYRTSGTRPAHSTHAQQQPTNQPTNQPQFRPAPQPTNQPTNQPQFRPAPQPQPQGQTLNRAEPTYHPVGMTAVTASYPKKHANQNGVPQGMIRVWVSATNADIMSNEEFEQATSGKRQYDA